jgi:acyl carrier protein
MNRNKDEIISKIKKCVSKIYGIEESEINNDYSFVDDLKGDSLDTVELLLLIEEEFDISIPDEQAVNISTVNDIISFMLGDKHDDYLY